MSDEIKKVLNSEKLSYELYSKLERIERNKQLKKKLKELKELDVKHIKVWTEIYNELDIPVKENGNKLSLFLFILLRRLFGSGLTLSVINSLEN